MKEAVERARKGHGPTFLEAKTYRIVPHSSDDDDRRYRSREEVDEWGAKDPVVAFARRLKESGVLDDKAEQELNDRVNREVDEATDEVEQEPISDPASALRHVFVEEEGA
jgi:2-oxoisovalerate dehydrogenase E1 component alpha subunit